MYVAIKFDIGGHYIILQINGFFQSRKSQRTIAVILMGENIPLYGGGSNLSSKEGRPAAPVTLALNFTVRARAYVLGQMVKPRFHKIVHCSIVLDQNKMNVDIPLKNSCTFD